MPITGLLPSGRTASVPSFANDATPPVPSFMGSDLAMVTPSLVGNLLDPAAIPPAISLAAGETPAPPRITPRSVRGGDSSFALRTGGSNQEPNKPSKFGVSAMAP